MSRAAERSTRKLTDRQLAQQNQLISQASQQGAQDRSLLMPTVQSLLSSEGYTPQQRSAITQQSLGAANTAFDALRRRAANRLAATRNAAGYGDLLAQLGREQAQTQASQAQQNQIAFADRQLQEQLAGLHALGQTYGIDTNLLGRAMGIPAELLSVRQRASSGSSGLSGLFGLGSSIASLFG
jgi:D-alanyl-D-alanine dipeptidase